LAQPAIPSVPSWEHFPHGADVGVRGRGRTREEAFEQAAAALAAIATDPSRIEPQQSVSVECSADDDELLLVSFLDAIIYEMATRRMLFRRASVAIDGRRLEARLEGEAVDAARHEPAVEPKGATLTAARVERAADSWVAQCVVDV
jgi:SHS2 domain-containing protein